MSAAVDDIEDFFSPAVSLLGLYNAEEKVAPGDDKDAIQQTIQGHTEQLWQFGKKVGDEMTKLKDRLQLLDKRAERLSKDMARIVGKLDHKTVQHRWQQVMSMYAKYGKRIRDLLQLCMDLDLAEDGVLYPAEAAEAFANDVLGNTGNLNCKECLFHIHHMIIGGTLFTNAPLFHTYHDLADTSPLRHQSVRWHVQVYMSHVIAIELAGMVLLTTALNIMNRHEEMRRFQEDMKIRLEEQDRLIRDVTAICDPTFYPSNPVEKIAVTYVDAKTDNVETSEEGYNDIINGSARIDIDAKNESTNDNLINGFAEPEPEKDKWSPIMGAQLFRKQEGVLSIRLTVMQCPAIDPSRQWGPPKLTKVSENICEIPMQHRSHVLGQRVTLNWSRVTDPLTECICGVRFVTEPRPADDDTTENPDESDVTETPAPQLGLECVVFSKNSPNEPKYILPPCFDEHHGDFVVTRGGQGKRLNLFQVDVGRVVPKQPGWVTGVRLHLRGDDVLSIGLETSYW